MTAQEVFDYFQYHNFIVLTCPIETANHAISLYDGSLSELLYRTKKEHLTKDTKDIPNISKAEYRKLIEYFKILKLNKELL